MVLRCEIPLKDPKSQVSLKRCPVEIRSIERIGSLEFLKEPRTRAHQWSSTSYRDVLEVPGAFASARIHASS